MNTKNIKQVLNKLLPFLVFSIFVTSVMFSPLEAFAQQKANTPVAEGLDCGIFNTDQCIALVGKYAFYLPASSLLVVAGSLFDAMIAFSLSAETINQPFVMDAWKTVRDIANISFIFVLLYIAIATILSLGDYKKLLTNLIIVALIINFSAFFTKIIIDASNIIAFEFYNAISVDVPSGSDVNGLSVQEKRISLIFLKGFDSQRLMSSEAVKNWKNSGEGVSMLFFVFIAAGIVNIVAAFVLFMAGFLMLGRVVAFWFLIIASPIAFVAVVIPGARSLFSKWLNYLIDQALVAPVFLFFMYIIANIVQSNFLKNIFRNPSDGVFDIIVNIVLVFSVLLITLLMALDVTKKLSGGVGKMTTKYAGGNLAVKKFKSASRHLAGRGASRLAESERIKSLGRRLPGAGMAIDTALDKMGAGKYNKYMKEREKKKTGYGAKVAGESRVEKLKRLRNEDKLRVKRDSGEIDSTSFEKEMDLARDATEKTNEARQKEYVKNLEHPGKFSKIIQRITGEEIADRQAAVKVRKGEKGEDSLQEQFEKLAIKVAKEKESEAKPPTPPTNEEAKK